MYTVMNILYFSFNVIDWFSDFSQLYILSKSKFSTKVTRSLLFNYLLIHKIRAVLHLAEYERIRAKAKEDCSGNTLGRGEGYMLQACNFETDHSCLYRTGGKLRITRESNL